MGAQTANTPVISANLVPNDGVSRLVSLNAVKSTTKHGDPFNLPDEMVQPGRGRATKRYIRGRFLPHSDRLLQSPDTRPKLPFSMDTIIYMRRHLFYFSAFFILAISSATHGQKAGGAAKPDPARDVRAAFDRLAEGIRQVDPEKVMSVYEKSDRTLFFNNNGSATLGWQTMHDNRVASYAKTKNVTLDVTGLRVELLSPAAAYVTCKWKQTQEYEGKLENASGRMTLVFKKIGKNWKVVHLHTSPDSPPPTRPVLPSERDSSGN